MSEHCCKTDACRISDLEAERDTLIERVLAHERIEMDLMAQRDALKARVGKLETVMRKIVEENESSYVVFARAALAEDGGNK